MKRFGVLRGATKVPIGLVVGDAASTGILFCPSLEVGLKKLL
jgi:hypothetical protein